MSCRKYIYRHLRQHFISRSHWIQATDAMHKNLNGNATKKQHFIFKARFVPQAKIYLGGELWYLINTHGRGVARKAGTGQKKVPFASHRGRHDNWQIQRLEYWNYGGTTVRCRHWLCYQLLKLHHYPAYSTTSRSHRRCHWWIELGQSAYQPRHKEWKATALILQNKSSHLNRPRLFHAHSRLTSLGSSINQSKITE